MKNIGPEFPIIKLPNDIQITLYLIREELKSRKLFRVLSKAGLDDCYFQPHLDTLILRNLGLDDGTDNTFNFYSDIIERRSKKIKPDNDSIMKQAIKVYEELTYNKAKS